MTNVPSGPRWYVAQTQPHAEARAVAHLERQGFLPFLPRYLKQRRHARRTEIVGVPVFPRYVFVSMDKTRQRWHAIRSTIGIARIIERSDGPVAVTPGIVEGLIARQDENGYIRLTSPAGLKAGDSVRVLGGAFEECLGLLEQISDEERVTILLDLLGRKVRVSLDAGLIAAA